MMKYEGCVSDSIWDKFMPVPFTRRITGEDPNFETKVLQRELPGILNFAIAGLKKLRANNYRLPEPEQVRDAREVERDVQDPFAEWFADNMEKCAERSPCDVIYDNYTAWCVKNKTYSHKRQKLTRWLGEKQNIDVQQSNASKFYVGIRPKLKGAGSTGNEPGF